MIAALIAAAQALITGAFNIVGVAIQGGAEAHAAALKLLQDALAVLKGDKTEAHLTTEAALAAAQAEADALRKAQTPADSRKPVA